MKRLRDFSLGVKLNLLLVAVLGVLLIATVSLLVYNTRKLTQEIANERINEEVKITQKHIAEIQKQLAVDVNFTASSIPFVQAVGRRSPESVTELITGANTALEMDDIDVYDGDGKLLASLQSDETTTSEMITNALANKAASGVVAEVLNGQLNLTINAAAPVVSLRQGTVLGAVEMSRKIDNAFLDKLTFQRNGVFLGVIYDNKIQVRNITDPIADNTVLYQNIAFDPALVKTASSGKPIVSNELTFTSSVPYTIAYIPLIENQTDTPITLMVMVELKEISTFQNDTLANTIIVFAALALLAILIIYLSMQQIALRPLAVLTDQAKKMTGGEYDERIAVTAHDEVGNLAETFNEMATAIQQRETNLQAARAQAERSDQVKSAFLASMSHELRTPLNAVINFTTFVVDGDTGPVNEEQADLLKEVIGSARHLLNLINDVLDMSKIEAGSLNLFIEESVDLNNLLTNVATTGRGLLADKPIQFEVDLPEHLSPIRADKQRILQILLNLVSNACKFTKEGKVQLKAVQENGEVIISVADTGPGIAPEEQSLVFEAFKQTKSGARQAGGTGLGMPIAKSLAEAHKGRLWFNSEVGKGTTFYVAIPIKSEELVPALA